MKLKKVIINGEIFYKEVGDEAEEKDVDIDDDEDEEDDNDDEEEDDEDDEDEEEDDEDDEDEVKFNYKDFKHIHNGKYNKIIELLPFLNTCDCDELVKKIIEKDEEYVDIPFEIFLPFISQQLCDQIFIKLLIKEKSIKYKAILPFVSTDILSQVVERYINGEFQDLNFNSVYPFLKADDVKKLLEYKLKKSKNK